MDPDTVLYAPLTPVWEGLRDANVVVTPHIVDPVSGVDFPWEQDLLRHGGFNLGFIGASATAESDRLLRWWEDRCLTCGFNAAPDGFFVDQKFMDQAHMFFDGVKVLRHKGLNIAYWNLHERPLHQVDGTWMVEHQPLIFMHFSGFDFAPKPSDVMKVSRYPSTVSLDTRPEIAPLFHDYRNRLKDNRYAELAKLPYSYSSFDNGVPVTRLARRLLGTGALVVQERTQPFRADSPIYKALKEVGALPKLVRAGAPTPRDRDAEQVQLRQALGVMSWLFRRLGVTRYESLLKFMTYAGSTLNQGFLVQR
jgi:hypothetical protein